MQARIARCRLDDTGKFWQEDYYDTFIRDEAHLKRAIRYTELNPVRAFLAKTARQWPWSSACHRDEYERLPWQTANRSTGFSPLNIRIDEGGLKNVNTADLRELKRRERRAPTLTRSTLGSASPLHFGRDS